MSSFKEITTNLNTAVVISVAIFMLGKFSVKTLATANCVSIVLTWETSSEQR
jgi:hypothetical protein